jgi:hypothetical protein
LPAFGSRSIGQPVANFSRALLPTTAPILSGRRCEPGSRAAALSSSNPVAGNSRRIRMRKTLLSALAATTILSAGMLASRAAAMTSAVSAGTVTASDAPDRVASILCGSNGCGVVQTKQVKRRKLMWLGHG